MYPSLFVSNKTKHKWNKIYTANHLPDTNLEENIATVLLEHEYLLPESGIALDFACGLGANAIFLAKHGLTTHAWDISQHAANKLQAYCIKEGLSISTEVRDLEQNPPVGNSFDVICVSYYLERALIPYIISALKVNGLLFYQTFIHEKATDKGPSNPLYRLAPNELLKLFSTLHILVYQEYGQVGNIKKGLRDVAMLVAQKRQKQ